MQPLENISSAPQSTFSFASNTTDSKAKIVTNPLVDISTLIRSKAAETGPESIMGTMAKSIRQVGRRGDATVRDADLEGRNLNQEQEDESESEDDASHVLASTLRNLHLEPPEYRFFGKSSGAMLIRRAMEMKSDFVRRSSSPAVASSTYSHSDMTMAVSLSGSIPLGHAQGEGQGFETLPAVPSSQSSSNSAAMPLRQRRGALLHPPTMKNLRPEFWLPRPVRSFYGSPSISLF